MALPVLMMTAVIQADALLDRQSELFGMFGMGILVRTARREDSIHRYQGAEHEVESTA